MRIVIVTPAPPGSRSGNRITANRWARHLRALGHRVDVRAEGIGPPRDLMIAIHARKALRQGTENPRAVFARGTVHDKSTCIILAHGAQAGRKNCLVSRLKW